MSSDFGSLLKAFAPKIMARAIQTFDRATIVVVTGCWAAALLTMLFALYALNIAATAKRDVTNALATEPALPKMISKGLEQQEIQPLVERLQKQFSDVTVAASGDGVNVTAQDGSKFRRWLTVLSYIDTMSPQYRWSIKDFCVGSKCGGAPMNATLVAEKIAFAPP